MLFFQFDVSTKMNFPPFDRTHFTLFLCPKCNEIPCFESFAGKQLPREYWEKTEGHFFAMMHRLGEKEARLEPPRILRPYRLDWVELKGAPNVCDSLRLGGEPHWLQGPDEPVCSCGSPMKLLCQLP